MTLHSPSIPALCYLLRGEERATLAWRLWMSLLQPISDSEEDDPLTYGLMPPELKAKASELKAGLPAEGECCRLPKKSHNLGCSS